MCVTVTQKLADSELANSYLHDASETTHEMPVEMRIPAPGLKARDIVPGDPAGETTVVAVKANKV